MGDLDKLIAAKGFKSCPKSNNSPNLVTLQTVVIERCIGMTLRPLSVPLSNR